MIQIVEEVWTLGYQPMVSELHRIGGTEIAIAKTDETR